MAANEFNKQFYKIIIAEIKKSRQDLESIDYVYTIPINQRQYQKTRILQHIETLEYVKSQYQKLQRKIKKAPC